MKQLTKKRQNQAKITHEWER